MDISGNTTLNVTTSANQSATVNPSRTTQTTAQTAPGRKFNPVVLIAVLVALLIGALIGWFVTRQRYRAREVVVAVNGVIIDKEALYHRLENLNGTAVVRQMVGEELQYQFAKKMGKAPTQAAIEAKLQEVMKQPNFAENLVANHITLDDVRHELRSQLSRQAVLTRDVPVTEAEAKRFYERNIQTNNPKALFYTPEAAQIRVIVTLTREQADNAIQALRNGRTFENAVAVYSRDQSRATGGVLPPILRGRTTSAKLPQLERAIFALKIGGISEPVQAGGAWWIIQCLDKAPANIQSYEQVREQCYLGAALTKLSAANAQKIEADFVDFQKHATIQAFWSRYAKAVDLK